MLFLNSYAKLNLYLEVLNLRKDSYHNIKTLFERIDLHDKIILKSRPDKSIKIICSSADVPCDTSNLTYRSTRLLQERFNINKGVEIKIIKRIPVGAGLGGGSSNAASVLRGLNKLWRLNLTPDKLADFAKGIGSDVPFFIYNYPFAFGEGRPDKIKPLKTLKNTKLWHILVVPKIKVSTASIYKRWDAYLKHSVIGRAALTRPKYDVRILNLALKKFNLTLLSKILFNSLEIITTKLYPQVILVKEKLKELGVESILMSGSGPAVFGVVSSRKEAVSLKEQLKGESNFWRVFVTKTV